MPPPTPAPSPAPAPPPAAVEPPPPRPAPRRTEPRPVGIGVHPKPVDGEWDLTELERLVEAHAEEYPDRVEEWRYYLIYLGDFVGATGRLSGAFDALVRDVFRELVERSDAAG